MIGAFSREARQRSLKRRLLRAAVDENLDLINGRPPRVKGKRRRVFVPALLAFGGLGLLATSTQVGQSKLTNAASPVPTTSAASMTPVATTTSTPEPGLLVAPQAIDPAVLRLVVQKIVVDPGHGGNDPGALAGQGLEEKSLTLDIGQRFADLLQSEGYSTVMTRNDDTTLSLQDRTRIANEVKGDLFVSIHINFIPVRLRRGIETYYLGPTSDPQIERLATVENAVSGYSLADFRGLLERVYTDVRQAESRQLAEAVQNRLFMLLHQTNPKLENRGVKKAPFVVLIGTEMPSILAEVSCISNQDEARLLRREEYRQSIASALASGVRTYAASRSQTRLASRRTKELS